MHLDLTRDVGWRPNITGTLQVGGFPLHTANHTGAFYGTDYGTADYHGQDGRSNVPKAFGIDASKVSSIFGESSTVQPAALELLPCIKT